MNLVAILANTENFAILLEKISTHNCFCTKKLIKRTWKTITFGFQNLFIQLGMFDFSQLLSSKDIIVSKEKLQTASLAFKFRYLFKNLRLQIAICQAVKITFFCQLLTIMEIQVVELGQVRLGCVRLGQGQVRLGRVRLGFFETL